MGATQSPSVGRIIHFIPALQPSLPNQISMQFLSDHQAAVIAQVPDGNNIILAAFNSGTSAVEFHSAVPRDDTGTTPFSWHFPEYVA